MGRALATAGMARLGWRGRHAVLEALALALPAVAVGGRWATAGPG